MIASGTMWERGRQLLSSVIEQTVQGFASFYKKRAAFGAKIRILFDMVKT